ncbi:ORF-S [Elephant endotheliotropic herpesvirus 6]|nr:ORF-S [Elephant endotheliotropic herpesvirus 6]
MSALMAPPMVENQQFRDFSKVWEAQTKKRAGLEIQTQGNILKGKLVRRLRRQMHAYIRRNTDRLRAFRRGHVETSRDPQAMMVASNLDPELIQSRTTLTMKRFIRNAKQEADCAILSCKNQMNTQIDEIKEMLIHMASLDMEMSRHGAIQHASTPVQILEDIIENAQVREERGQSMPKEAVTQGVESVTREAKVALMKWEMDRWGGWTDRVHKSGKMKDVLTSPKFIASQLGPYMEGIEERYLTFFQNCTLLDMESTGLVMHHSWAMIQKGFMGKGQPLGRTLKPRK